MLSNLIIVLKKEQYCMKLVELLLSGLQKDPLQVIWYIPLMVCYIRTFLFRDTVQALKL